MESPGNPISPSGSEPFLWGVAISSYQTEGGFNAPGQPRTNWAVAEERGTIEPVGAAADFWNRHSEDFAAARAMGLNAFRMGISWSRVQPSFAPQSADAEPPPFDPAALGHYAVMFARCREAGLEPLVTLHHFVHPEWLGPDPWLDPQTPARFTAFCRHAVHAVNDDLVTRFGQEPLKWFITTNEPNILTLNSYLSREFPARAKGGRRAIALSYNHILSAHVLAYNALHDLYVERGWPRPRVGLNTYCTDIYPNEMMLYDLLEHRVRGVPREDLHKHLIERATAFDRALIDARIPFPRTLTQLAGRAFHHVASRMGGRMVNPESFALLLDTIQESSRPRVLDFIGLDYYDPFTSGYLRFPILTDHPFRATSPWDYALNAVTSKWWDWRAMTEGLEFFCTHYAEAFAPLPLLIAENGMALYRRRDNRSRRRRDRLTRSDYLRKFIPKVRELSAAGLPLLGYFHWSLVDNYEWGTYTPRFGLLSIDYSRGTDRSITDPSGDRPSETYRDLIS